MIDKKEMDLSNYDLKYGTNYLEFSIYYLMKIKKIDIFEIIINDKTIQCIKVLKDINDKVEEKDKTIMNLMIKID